jgi:DNA-binding beta-propeller fold protein YncE
MQQHIQTRIRWTKMVCIFVGTVACSATLTVAVSAQNAKMPLSFDKTILLEKVKGRIDHLAADVAGQRLFVAALGNDSIEVVDLQEGRLIETIPGFAEPQGIAFVPEFGRIFVANGRDGSCRILDSRSLKTIHSVECGDDADNVRYDKDGGRIYVGYGSGALAVLDAKTGAKLANIKLAAHPESFQLETAGTRIFVNVPNAGHIAVVDRNKGQVVDTWSLNEAKSNFPLALDQTEGRLFIGCRNPPAILVYDFTTHGGRFITRIPIAGDTDDLFYDSSNKLLYVSCGQGMIQVVCETDRDHFREISSLRSASGARTSLLIPELKLFCLAVPRHGNQPAEILLFKTR